jgi:S-DNA-T family DNA segregation ATPase FtsK/SpoIIIE
MVRVARCDGAFQEVFGRERVREILRAYVNNQDPLPIRRAITGDDVWAGKTYVAPTPAPKKQTTQGVASPQVKVAAGKGVSEPLVRHAEPSPSPAGPATAPVQAWCYDGVSGFLLSKRIPAEDATAGAAWLKDTESQCKGALQQFQLQAKLVTSILTPNAAILKFRGTSNLTVDQVIRRRSEFLTTHGLNLVSVRAEPGIVSLSIARPDRHILRLPNVWAEWTPGTQGGNCELLIAVREEDSSLLFLSPQANAPHTLVAGSTGSGKSVLMQNILLSIAVTNHPSQAQILLIDPKMGVDYFAFEGLPHLRDGIVDDQQKAHAHLSELVVEMDRRYRVLRENRVSNVFELNSIEKATEHLPFLWVVHDEFAEWMLTPEYREQVTDVVARLGVKARAAGIFLVFAAQRPDSNVMPMQLRANLGNRLILRVDSEGTSEIALGEKGAERLLGKGHLAARIEGESDIVTAQVPFVNATEIEELVRIIRESPAP